MRKFVLALPFLVAVGVLLGAMVRDPGQVSIRRRLAEAHNRKTCKPCKSADVEVATASVLPSGVLGSLLGGVTKCSWGNKDFYDLLPDTTLTKSGVQYHIAGIGGPCQANGDTACSGVLVKMLAKEHLGQEPPWDVKFLTCTAVNVDCDDELHPGNAGYFEMSDPSIIANYGTGNYFMAVDLYKTGCSPLGAHVFGTTVMFTL